MIRLKIILKYSYLIVLLFTIFYVKNFTSKYKYKSKYNLDNTYVLGYIKDIKRTDDKLKVVIDDVLINFYSDSIPADLNIGDFVKIEGEFIIPSTNTTPNLFNYRNYLYSTNIHYILKPKKYTKINKGIPFIYNIKRNLIKYFSTFKSNSYLLTFILGCNYEIDSDVTSSYNKNGISHLFALSGMHVSMLTCILLFILTKIIKEKNAYIICTLFLIFYLFLTGFSKSIVRAAFLFFFITFKKIFKVNIDIKIVYILFTCFMLILNPYNIYNNAFLYSYLISFCLICYGDIINNFKNYFIKVFVTSLISFIVGIPISVNASFELNLISPILNIIFVPIISLVIFPLTLLTAILPFLDKLTYFLMLLVEKISLYFSNINCFRIIIPHMNITLIIIFYLLFLFVIYKARKKKYKYLFIIILYIFLLNNINYFRNYALITVIDIGQGDSILINFPHNKGTFLIDTGGKYGQTFSYANNTTIPYLKSLGIKKINFLILSHGDADHAGESLNILNNFKVKNVLMNSGHNNYLENEIIALLKQKNISYKQISKYQLNYNGYVFNFINDKDILNENEDSLVFSLKIDNIKLLFTGDAGISSEEYLLKTYNLANYDILKVGHHGSSTSSSLKFINTINPKYALISVGNKNKFGHPHQKTLDNLSSSKIYRTDLDGSIEIKLNKNGYKIRTCPP